MRGPASCSRDHRVSASRDGPVSGSHDHPPRSWPLFHTLLGSGSKWKSKVQNKMIRSKFHLDY